MPEPDFDQLAEEVLEGENIDPWDWICHKRVAEKFRQVWNARGAADAETLEAALAAQHDKIWRSVETHWVRKEAREDLALRAEEAETKVSELTALLRESKRDHDFCDNDGCPKAMVGGENAVCDCGADAWNARIDAVLD